MAGSRRSRALTIGGEAGAGDRLNILLTVRNSTIHRNVKHRDALFDHRVVDASAPTITDALADADERTDYVRRGRAAQRNTRGQARGRALTVIVRGTDVDGINDLRRRSGDRMETM